MKVVCNSCNQTVEKTSTEIKRSLTGKFYCSRSCSAKMNNLGRQRNPPKLRLCQCGTEYVIKADLHDSTILCHRCVKDRDYRSKTLAEYHSLDSVRNKHSSWRNAHLRHFSRTWNKQLLEKPCANCLYSKHVEICHIKPVASFPETATLGEIHASTNVIQLCPNCHWEFDNGLLTLSS